MKINKYSSLATTVMVIMVSLSWQAYERINYGEAIVTDGDTIKIGINRIRLFGIDAPEKKQVCKKRKGKEAESWNCGIEATEHLSKLIDDSKVFCFMIEKDRYKRLVSICLNKRYQDIGREMVKAGYSVAYAEYSTLYVNPETEAKRNKIGIWAGEFVKPEDYRKSKKR